MGKLHDRIGQLMFSNDRLWKSLEKYKGQLKTISEAFERSEYDISPCETCGLPTVCLPDGIAPICKACYAKEPQP